MNNYSPLGIGAKMEMAKGTHMSKELEGRRIVVGVDGSDRSVAALRWALDEAAAHGGNLKVVTVWDVPATIFLTPTFTEGDYAARATAALEHTLSAVDVGAWDVPVEAEIAMGSGGQTLVELALGADLLVIAAHGLGHGAVPGGHLGSVAGYCAHHARCPTVIVRE